MTQKAQFKSKMAEVRYFKNIRQCFGYVIHIESIKVDVLAEF